MHKHILKILQNASFGLSLFAATNSKKSNHPKSGILKDFGYIYFLKPVFSLFFCFFSATLFAVAQNCQPLSIDDTTIHLETNKPVYIVFHNTTMHNIYITAPSSLGASLLEPDRWSMLALGEKTLSLDCVESRPGHEQVVSCKGALTICQFTTPAKDLAGTKWLTENAVQSPQVDI